VGPWGSPEAAFAGRPSALGLAVLRKPGIDPKNRMFLLDLWRQQASSNVWIEAFCDLVIKWKPQFWAEEKTQITSGVGPFIRTRAIERRAYTNREQFPTRGDKGIRAQSIRGRMELMGLYVPAGAVWLPDLRAELLAFPMANMTTSSTRSDSAGS
jgi:phage terminase large subunit-like protein